MSPSRNRPSEDDHQRKILVVDDEPTLRLWFAYALTSKLAVVDTASNGREALDQIEAKRYEIMILDLRMPDLDGSGVIEALRAAGNQLPIILCTAALTPTSALHAIENRVVGFLLKPVRPKDLRSIIESTLSPERDKLSQALKTVRLGNWDDAIKLLQSEENPCHKVEAWLRVITAIRHHDVDSPTSQLHETVRSCLNHLAYN